MDTDQNKGSRNKPMQIWTCDLWQMWLCKAVVKWVFSTTGAGVTKSPSGIKTESLSLPPSINKNQLQADTSLKWDKKNSNTFQKIEEELCDLTVWDYKTDRKSTKHNNYIKFKNIFSSGTIKRATRQATEWIFPIYYQSKSSYPE